MLCIAKLQHYRMEASSRPGREAQEVVLEFYLIRHGESTANVHPSLVGGRSTHATLTTRGGKQARLLGEYLRDYLQLTFDAVYASTLVRAYDTAAITCAELGVAEREIHVADELQEQSQGEWEGRKRSEIFTPEVLARITAAQPDFCTPGGESQRQVELRMRRFLDTLVKAQLEEICGENVDIEETKQKEGYVQREETKSAQQQREDELTASLALMDLRNKEGTNGVSKVSHHPYSKLVTGSNESSSQSGLDAQEIHTKEEVGTSDASADAESRPVKAVLRRRIALFSHGMAIKCLLRSLLQSDPQMTHKLFIENTSVTLVKYSRHRGWHITKVNDSAHLVLAKRKGLEGTNGGVLPGNTYRYSS